MRPPLFRGMLDPNELVVDNFAGGGGASTGIEAAIGRPVDIAINHDAEAIAMHKANHPETKHYCENIWEVDPREACGNRPVGLAWFSPDCTHHSRAKGTVPLSKNIRGLAWVVIRWAKAVWPRIILLENVEEFQSWGPLDEHGRPDPTKVGDTFREWLAQLVDLGYELEFTNLVAADYGAPTTRKRLFLVARRDRSPIVWPRATHGAGRDVPWRPAAEIIDWSLPCPSIFERKRPLAEATLRRIAAGIERYVIHSSEPFIVGAGGPTYSGKPRGVSLPLGTITADNHRALVQPFMLRTDMQSDGRLRGLAALDEPLRTITSSGGFAIAQPFVVRHGHYSKKTGAGLRLGCGAGTFRGQPLSSPLATVCATNDKHLVVPLITKHYARQIGHDMKKTLGTVTARDHHSLTAAFLTKFYGTSVGSSAGLPLPTVTAGGGKGGGHLAEVRAFLIKYYGASGRAHSAQALTDPMHTVTSRARFGLVMIAGETYEIADIGMRMLQPHELFAAQGFPGDYEIAPEFQGKPLTKTAQISLAGNSVCPQVAEALVRQQVAA